MLGREEPSEEGLGKKGSKGILIIWGRKEKVTRKPLIWLMSFFEMKLDSLH